MIPEPLGSFNLKGYRGHHFIPILQLVGDRVVFIQEQHRYTIGFDHRL